MRGIYLHTSILDRYIMPGIYLHTSILDRYIMPGIYLHISANIRQNFKDLL